MNQTDTTELNTTEARQGVTPHMTRHVLRWGMIGVIVGFAVVWLIYGG
jgi:hypothetical protein